MADPGICRLCGLEKEQSCLIDFQEAEFNVPEKVEYFLHIKLEENPELSTKICLDCDSTMKSFQKFEDAVKYSQQSQKMQIRDLDGTSSEPKYILEIEKLSNTASEEEEMQMEYLIEVPDTDIVCEIYLPPKGSNKKSNLTIPEEVDLESVFSKEIAGTSFMKPLLDLNIPDDCREENGRVVTGALEPLSNFIDLKCNRCEEACVNLLELRTHFKQNHPTPQTASLLFGCKKCGVNSIKGEGKLFQHISSEHYINMNYICLVCEDFYWNLLELYAHYKNGHPEFYKSLCFCLMCGEHMSNNKISEHAAKHYRTSIQGYDEIFKDILSKEISDLENDLDVDECEKYPDGSVSESAIERLNLFKWIEFKSACGLCRSKSFSIHELKEHYDMEHSNANPKEKIYTCSSPGCVYTRNGDQIAGVYTHFLCNHNSELSLCCVVCSKYFWNRVLLHYHYLQHHENSIKMIYCLICGHYSGGMSTLKRHLLQSHNLEGIEKFFCSICGKEFAAEIQMKKHIESVHEDPQQLFECKICQTSKLFLKIK